MIKEIKKDSYAFMHTDVQVRDVPEDSGHHGLTWLQRARAPWLVSVAVKGSTAMMRGCIAVCIARANVTRIEVR